MVIDKFEMIYKNYKLQFYKDLFKKLNQFEDALTAFDFFCLETIYLLNNPTIGEFANFLEVSNPNVSYKIKNLIHKGYIRKINVESDKRIARLEVTDKFKKFYEQNDYSGMFVMRQIQNQLSKSENETLEAMLTLIIKQMKIKN